MEVITCEAQLELELPIEHLKYLPGSSEIEEVKTAEIDSPKWPLYQPLYPRPIVTDPNLSMRFTNNAYHDIINTVGSRRAESGGLLFGNLEDFIVREFVFDEKAQASFGSYTFDIKFLNKEIKRLWEEKQLACIGFLHSHPGFMRTPSGADMTYFREAFDWMPREKYLVPIVSTLPDGGFNLNPCVLIYGDMNITIASKIELVVETYSSKYRGYPTRKYKPLRPTFTPLTGVQTNDPIYRPNRPPRTVPHNPNLDSGSLLEKFAFDFTDPQQNLI